MAPGLLNRRMMKAVARPPYPKPIRRLFEPNRKPVRQALLAFGAWMGGAEMTIMLLAAAFMIGTGWAESVDEGVAWLHQASIAGAVLGILPAILVAVIVGNRKRRTPILPLAIISMPVTFVTALAWLVLAIGA